MGYSGNRLRRKQPHRDSRVEFSERPTSSCPEQPPAPSVDRSGPERHESPDRFSIRAYLRSRSRIAGLLANQAPLSTAVVSEQDPFEERNLKPATDRRGTLECSTELGTPNRLLDCGLPKDSRDRRFPRSRSLSSSSGPVAAFDCRAGSPCGRTPPIRHSLVVRQYRRAVV